MLFKFIICLFLFQYLVSAQDCSSYLTTFGCQEILLCKDTSGVCQCANGNQCSWNLNGNQTVNCPCYDANKKFAPYDQNNYCIKQFTSSNCGYETACNSVSSVGSCQCPDGLSSCIWHSESNLNCPCPGQHISLLSYRTVKFQACNDIMENYSCDPNGVMNCVGGGGSCTCLDGSLCVWGQGYAKGCPCSSSSGANSKLDHDAARKVVTKDNTEEL